MTFIEWWDKYLAKIPRTARDNKRKWCEKTARDAWYAAIDEAIKNHQRSEEKQVPSEGKT